QPRLVAEHVGAGAGAALQGGAEQVVALIGEAAVDVGAVGGGVARHDRAHQTHRPAGVVDPAAAAEGAVVGVVGGQGAATHRHRPAGVVDPAAADDDVGVGVGGVG